jgi:Transposase C of IS166 homeodomain
VSHSADDLPEDIEALKRLVLEQRAVLDSRQSEIESLKLLIAKLKRMQFGRSSERLAREIEQMELHLDLGGLVILLLAVGVKDTSGASPKSAPRQQVM